MIILGSRVCKDLETSSRAVSKASCSKLSSEATRERIPTHSENLRIDAESFLDSRCISLFSQPERTEQMMSKDENFVSTRSGFEMKLFHSPVYLASTSYWMFTGVLLAKTTNIRISKSLLPSKCIWYSI